MTPEDAAPSKDSIPVAASQDNVIFTTAAAAAAHNRWITNSNRSSTY